MESLLAEFFWFENFDSGNFMARKFWQVFFGWLDLRRDYFGYSRQSEDSS